MTVAGARTHLRELLAGDTCTLVAPIFDTLSAGIAQTMGWEVCKLSGSVTKTANLALPDEISTLANLSDFADIVRQVRRVAPDVSLSIDIDDAGGTRLSVYRTVRELEAAGISSIEIEDRIYPTRFVQGGDFGDQEPEEESEWGGSQGFTYHPIDEQVALLKTALAARQDPTTVIIARTAAFSEMLTARDALASEEALERIRAYSKTGVDAIMIPGTAAHVRADIEAIHSVTNLPLCMLRMPEAVAKDEAFERPTTSAFAT